MNKKNEKEESLIRAARMSYGLQAAAFFNGISSIAGVIISYSNVEKAEGTYVHSHFIWQIRTFWLALLTAICAFLVAIFVSFIFGLLLLIVNGIWVAYRLAKGWLRLSSNESMRESSSLDLERWSFKEKIMVTTALVLIVIGLRLGISIIDNENSKSLREDTQGKQELSLFGLELRNATRDEIRSAIRVHGGKAKEEDDLSGIDIYYSKDILHSSRSLEVFYVPNNNKGIKRTVFSGLVYHFPSYAQEGMTTLEELAQIIGNKYGEPEYANRFMIDTYIWHIYNKTLIKIKKSHVDGITLSYFFEDRMAIFELLKENYKKENVINVFKKQIQAF